MLNFLQELKNPWSSKEKISELVGEKLSENVIYSHILKRSSHCSAYAQYLSKTISLQWYIHK